MWYKDHFKRFLIVLAHLFFKIDRTVLNWGPSMEELLTDRAGEKYYHRIIHHLGMVGAFIQETGIIETIDEMIPKTSNNNSAHFTHGQVVALMIINGLGYTSRPLYMTHQYFLKKDITLTNWNMTCVIKLNRSFLSF